MGIQLASRYTPFACADNDACHEAPGKCEVSTCPAWIFPFGIYPASFVCWNRGSAVINLTCCIAARHTLGENIRNE